MLRRDDRDFGVCISLHILMLPKHGTLAKVMVTLVQEVVGVLLAGSVNLSVVRLVRILRIPLSATMPVASVVQSVISSHLFCGCVFSRID